MFKHAEKPFEKAVSPAGKLKNLFWLQSVKRNLMVTFKRQLTAPFLLTDKYRSFQLNFRVESGFLK
jgi:hypothetical protein